MKALTVAAILDGVTPRKDGSLTLRFITQEVSKDDIVATVAYYQQMGWVLFAPNEISLTDVPKESAIVDGTKSPAKRLRDRMFVYYKETDKGSLEQFNQWYERQLEKLGQQYLDRLDQ